MRWLALALPLLAIPAGCASFEDPTIVLDLRVLGIETTPPEQVLDVDVTRVPTFDELLAQLQPIRVRALVAEPDRAGPIEWMLTACIFDEGSRCDPEELSIEIGRGVLVDPELNTTGTPCPGAPSSAGTICAELFPDNVLVQMLAKAISEDPARGLGGIDIGISLHLNGKDEVFGAKHVRFAPRVPRERKANNNPNIDQLLLGRAGVGANLMSSHCADGEPIDTVRSGTTVTLFPVARDTDKEMYVLPTIDGGSEHFTEYLTYQWIATHGSFVDEVTGGPPDVFGNIRLDGTEWRAPEVDRDTLVTVWVLQRDSRYGVRWREACIKVEP